MLWVSVVPCGSDAWSLCSTMACILWKLLAAFAGMGPMVSRISFSVSLSISLDSLKRCCACVNISFLAGSLVCFFHFSNILLSKATRNLICLEETDVVDLLAACNDTIHASTAYSEMFL